MLTTSQVFALARLIDQRYSALVLLGTFGSLRWGELAALRRKDIDLAAATVRLERQLTELPGGGYRYGPPKSDASQRTIPIPDLIIPPIRTHLGTSHRPGRRFSRLHEPDWLAAPSWQLPTPGLASRAEGRRTASDSLSRLVDTHRDTFTADAGANLRELMERMGHSTTKAALVYLHSTSARQRGRAIADAVSKRAETDIAKNASGRKVARRPKRAS